MNFKSLARGRLLASGISVPAAVVSGTVAVLVGGCIAAVRLAGGPTDWVGLFFQYPGTWTAIALNVAAVVLSVAASRQFTRDEPLRVVWLLVTVAAAAILGSGLISQIRGEAWLEVRLVLGGPVATAVLVAAMAQAVRIYRRAGIQARLGGKDLAVIGAAVVFSAWQVADVALASVGQRGGFQQAVNLVNDPLLSVLLVEALLIRRSALRMGRGLIARCWGAFTAAILLTFVSDVGVWLSAHSPIPIPMAGTAWYLWFLASAAYAMAPAYQVEACRRAGK